MMEFVLALFVGAFAGVLTGLMGSSGVMAVVPGLILLGYSAHHAIGVSLMVDMFASVIVTWTYYRNRRVKFRQGLIIALPAILGAQIGTRLSVFIPDIGLSGGFGVLLLISAVIFWRHGTHRSLQALQDSSLSRRLSSWPVGTAIVVGLSLGIVSGMFGVGGGMLFMFALLLLGYELHLAIGTSTLIMALTTASGALGYMMLGGYPYVAMAGASIGTVFSGFFAARMANRMSDQNLGKAIAIVFGVLGVVIVISPLFSIG